jgi:hypothetical protein
MRRDGLRREVSDIDWVMIVSYGEHVIEGKGD